MARRKNAFLSDGSDSGDSASDDASEGYNSQEDADSRAERRLFEQKSKRRRTDGVDGKASAWEGIFGEVDDEGYKPRGGGRGRGRGGGGGGRKTDWTKAPAFVSKGVVQDEVETLEDQPVDTREASVDDAAEGGSASGSGSESGSEGSEDDSSEDESGRRSPLIREEEDGDDAQQSTAGLGRAGIGGRGGRGGIGSSRGGIGSSRGGLGAGRGGMAAAARSFAPASQVDSLKSTDIADADSAPASGASTPRPGIGASRGGIGSGRGGLAAAARSFAVAQGDAEISSGASTPRGGLGSGHAPGQEQPRDDSPGPSVPGAFGRTPTTVPTPSTSSTSAAPRRFVHRTEIPTEPAKTTPLTAEEAAHFNKMQRNIGYNILSGFGWAPGKGLGKNEDGRAVPVTAGKVLRGQGITKGVRTEDSKREARRKGELESDSEDEEKKRKARRGKGKAVKGKQAVHGEWQPPEQSWKKQRKVKVKVEHKTYEQILAEAEQTPSIGLVIDARGGEMKEVSSLSALSLSSWTPTSDTMQLPELRHNLRLVAEAARGDVEGLAKEGRAVNERRKWAVREEEVARKRVEDASTRIARLERIKDIVADISSTSTSEAKQPSPSLDPLSSGFTTLLDEYKAEYASLALDEVVVGAIASVTRSALSSWDPFDVSDRLASALIPWRRAFNLPADDSKAVVANGHETAARSVSEERYMTAWESLLWNSWMPKVRSAINNDWDARSPQAAVHLIETWNPILPAFIRENILDQLVLPKVLAAIDAWSPRKQSKEQSTSGKTRSLSSIVFPWLPLLGGRMDEVLEPAKRRMRSMLRSWTVQDGVPDELYSWKKSIYSSSEWDKLALSHIVPKLGGCLRDDFIINPANQDTQPIEWVMPWHRLLRASTFTHLVDVGFFPKWLDVLYIWLASPGCKFDEVVSWFEWWKKQFPETVIDMPAIAHGFRQGLDLMQQAMELGSASQSLTKPIYKPLVVSSSKSSKRSNGGTRDSTPSGVRVPTLPPQPTETDITFRMLAEDYAAQNDMIFVPLGKSHQGTGKPLFRVAKGIHGRGGVTVYVGEAAVFALVKGAENGGEAEYRAITLEDMVKRATGVNLG